MTTIYDNIRQWAEDRNLIKGSTPEKQYLKLIEEFGELAKAIGKNDIEQIKDAIGDMVVVVTIIAKQLGFKIESKYGRDKYLFERVEIKHSYNMKHAYGLHHISPRFVMCVSSNYEYKLMITLLACVCQELNLYLIDCVEHAYEQIKDRKGKMVDGIFQKE